MGVDFNELIENEVKLRVKSIVDDNVKLKNQITSLTRECESLKSKLSEVNDKADIIEAGKNIMSYFSEENIEQFIKLTPTYNVSMSDAGMNSIPMWFYLILKYWKNKKDIYNIFKFFNFKIPDWATEIKMPQEWNKEECIYFTKTINKHYVCNGQTYDRNLGFWYQDQGKNLINAKLMMDGKSYSEIPWQFVLANPLWTKDDDVFSAMVDCISSSKEHSCFFIEIEKYNNAMSDEQLKTFIKALIANFNKNKYNSYINFINKNIHRIKLTKNDKSIIEFVLKNGSNAKPHPESPDVIHVYYIDNVLGELKDKISYIEDCKKFTKAKKAELIKNYVLEKYNSTNLAKSLLEEKDE